jgi:glycine/D-amino acid oxidase-like deaminating enzyme
MTTGESNGLAHTADVVILGTGVMGTSIAFHLAQRKAGMILVLDKDHVGRERIQSGSVRGEQAHQSRIRVRG